MIRQIDQKWFQGKYLRFEDRGPVSPEAKTKLFAVTSALSGAFLGSVKWFVPWRRYCFFPANSSIFDTNCLGDLMEFCNERTVAHKEINNWR